MFAVSGVAKCFSFRQFGSTMQHLGFPAALTGWMKAAVVAGELSAAILLYFDVTRWIGCAFTIMLFAGFYWSVYRSRSVKEKLECNCFGPLTSETLGITTLVRLFVLTAIFITTLFFHIELQETPWPDQLLSVTACIGTLLLYVLGQAAFAASPSQPLKRGI